MKTFESTGIRSFLVAAVVAIGIATILASGGGSGSLGPGTPPTTNDPTLAITADNGEAVAATILSAIGLSFDLGDVSDATLAGPAETALSTVPVKSLSSLYSKTYSQDPHAIEACAVSGTVDITFTVANPSQPTVGDRIVAIFDQCDDNLGYVISGTVDLTVSDLQGDTLGSTFLIGFQVLFTDVVVTEGTESITSNGDFTLTIDRRGYPVIIMTMSGDTLEVSTGGETMTLTGFDHSLTTDFGVIPDTKVAEVLGRLGSLLLNGSVDYETIVPVEGLGDLDPHTGVILITGADGSTVRIVLVDSANITLEIDVNGDGVIEAYVYTSWAELTGQPSPPSGDGALINLTTALDVARETYNAVVGFGSIAASAGGQFAPTAVFGQIQQMAVSGIFGPLTIDCATSGMANVSGSLAAAGTFTAGDQLYAVFLSCARGGDVLDGGLNFSVGSFDQTPGDAYLVSGTTTHDQFRRYVGGSCHTGTGVLTTTHDFVYATAGLAFIDSAATSYTVASGGRSQALSDAEVHTQIQVGQQPLVITRASSGTFTSAELVGSYRYESLVPDAFRLDDDAVTGPYSGVLLVTANDRSTLRMVAMDDINVRLDLDFNGDSIIDQRIATTWTDFDYGNAFGICDLPPAP